ncbi:MAG TPA: CpsD/CapB family tyrosine-protein kinase [Candidatus Acidoferrum sp.]|nr:CpsD/CapB family tyrosine-protein kinase [Candidatus Acidoferrum sp.]
MSKNFELLQQAGRGDFFNLPNPPNPISLDTPSALSLRREVPDTEIAKLAQRLFSQKGAGCGPKAVSFSGIEHDNRSSWICARAGEALADQVDASVCIVDANLWSPQLHGHVTANSKTGLVDALAKEGPIRSFATPFCSGNLWLISAGAMKPGLRVPMERYRTRFKELREEFDYILISAPPLSHETEAILIAQLVDGIVLIIEANHSRREAVRRAKEQLESAHVPLLGAVLDQRTFPIPEKLYRRL